VQSFWVIGLVTAITILLLFFLRRTFWGRQWRAAAQNPTGARLCGVNPAAVTSGSVVVASVLVTMGGIAIAPIVLAGGFYGLTFGVKGFVAAILGGFESTGGAIVGGMTIGILESFLAGQLSNAHADIILFAVLILMLIVRPKGLIAVREATRA
jgi:branched-chain amino acid transport system permease protein